MGNVMENNVEYESCCCFNDGVSCSDYKCGNCSNCGWNPYVAAERIKGIRAKRQAELVKNQ